MITKARGIILHTTRYGESSLVVHCYTQEYGRQTYMVKGVRKSRRNNRANLFQPLFLLNFEVYRKEKSEMHLVKEVSRDIALVSFPYDVSKSAQALFMAEMIYRAVREEEPNPVLSQFLFHSVQYLDAIEGVGPDFHIVFLFQLSKYMGIYPQNNFSEKNRYFDLLSGKFRPWLQDPDIQLDERISILWSKYLGRDFSDSAVPGMSGDDRMRILDALVRYYRNHVDGMGEIRSLEVLHSIFHNL